MKIKIRKIIFIVLGSIITLVVFLSFLEFIQVPANARSKGFSLIYTGNDLSIIASKIGVTELKEEELESAKRRLPANFNYGEKLYYCSDMFINYYFGVINSDNKWVVQGVYFENT